MPRQYWNAPLPPLNFASGTALASSTTLTDVSPTPQVNIAAGLLEPGMLIRLRAFGVWSNTGTPTLLVGFYYGGVAGVALAATSALTTASGVTNLPFDMEYVGRVRTNGSSGTIMGKGHFDFHTTLTAFTVRPIPETTLATVTIDTTTSKALTVGAQWGTSSSSNTLTCHHLDVEIGG
jgi:hypothetical protein